jgi:hypothetical protein
MRSTRRVALREPMMLSHAAAICHSALAAADDAFAIRYRRHFLPPPDYARQLFFAATFRRITFDIFAC